MANVNIEKLTVNTTEQLWNLFEKYHQEVSGFSGEQPLPTESKFKDFWLLDGKMAFFLKSDSEYIGFVLLQEVINTMNSKYLEVGAIYVKPNFRGYSSIKLYERAFEEAVSLGLSLGSEIAADNQTSIGMFNSLLKRYSTRLKIKSKKHLLENGRVFVECTFPN